MKLYSGVYIYTFKQDVEGTSFFDQITNMGMTKDALQYLDDLMEENFARDISDDSDISSLADNHRLHNKSQHHGQYS